MQVAVGEVVHHLSNGPPIRPIGRIELMVRETFNGIAEPAWKLGEFQQDPAVVFGIQALARKTANGIAN